MQSIADNLIEADAANDPGTAGYVSRSTLLYVAACVDEVPLVYRVCGDRDTGEFDGVDIASSVGSAGVHIPPAAIETIGRGEIKLSVTKAEL